MTYNFDASASSDPSGRPLVASQFRWATDNGAPISLSALVAAARGPRLTLNSSTIGGMPSGGYSLTVHVTSFLGVASAATARFDISKDADMRRPAVSIKKLAKEFRRARARLSLAARAAPHQLRAVRALTPLLRPPVGMPRRSPTLFLPAAHLAPRRPARPPPITPTGSRTA